MAKILLSGVGPLPCHGEKQLFAPGLRVWMFATTLAAAGHSVRLALGDFANLSSPRLQLFDLTADAMQVKPVNAPAAATLEQAFANAADSYSADCIITSTDVMANAAARCGSSLPLWVDFYGSPMAERQQQAAMHSHNGGLASAWRMIVPALLRGDYFSACSEWQRLALIGELGACGRLNSFTAGHDLVSSIPPGVSLPALQEGEPIFRGHLLPEDAFIVLWTGGFNTWTDVQTLHAGIIAAMERDARIHFLSTGGAIPGHCEHVYPQFQQLVANGPFAERFHLQGWIDLECVRHAWLEADLAINIDTFSYEGLLGTRTRLLDWMQAGLPIATTVLSELTDILAQRDLVYSFQIGRADDLSRVILAALHNPVARRTKARQAREFLQHEWTNEQLLAPMLQWARNPMSSPDRIAPANSLAQAQSEMADSSLLRDEIASLQSRNAQLEQELSRLKGSRVVKTFMRMKRWK